MEASQPSRIDALETLVPAPHITRLGERAHPSGPIPIEMAPADHADWLREQIDWYAFLPSRAAFWSWSAQQAVKRLIDIVFSLVLLVLLSPVFFVVALLVKFSSPGPIFYPFRVLGKHGRRFVAYKFRTMVEDADALKPDLLRHNEMRGPAFKMRNDPRITPIGRWLRKFSIDELPQLWSVFVGDMSLVGPRPPFAEEFVQYKTWQWARLAVTPGITCIWQVTGRSDIRDFDEWAALDAEYIKNWSIWLDLKILLMTVPAVLRGKGAY